MWILAVALLSLGLLVGAAELLMRRRGGETAVAVEPKSDCSTCTGSSDKCEQECMMEAATKEIEYYDDEELDAFRGRPSSEYTAEEAEQFGYVLSTMRDDEVAGWCRSLTLRGIELPDQIKDEVVMIVEEFNHTR
jgi:hypothetical protein